MPEFLTFLIAATADWLSCKWMDAREQRSVPRIGLIAAAIELWGWLPLLIAYQTQRASIIVAAVIGACVGSMLGVKQMDREGEYICPKCGSDHKGEPIPENERWMFGNATHFSRRILHKVLDGPDYWLCPDCGKDWPA